MDGKMQIIAGILAVFFLGVAIAKSMVQRARRREAAAKSIASSRAGATVSLHNPFNGQAPETPAAPPNATAHAAPVAAPPTPAPPSAAPRTGGSAAPPPTQESLYKWV